MAYHDTDLATVLTAFQAKLIAGGTFSADNCRYSMKRPEGVRPQPGTANNLFCLLYPSTFAHDEALFTGGGTNQTTWDGPITVELYSAIWLDEAGYDPILLQDSARGISFGMKVILKALSGQMLTATYNAVTCDILRQPLVPQGGGINPPDGETPGSMSVNFHVLFDWDLS